MERRAQGLESSDSSTESDSSTSSHTEDDQNLAFERVFCQQMIAKFDVKSKTNGDCLQLEKKYLNEMRIEFGEELCLLMSFANNNLTKLLKIKFDIVNKITKEEKLSNMTNSNQRNEESNQSRQSKHSDENQDVTGPLLDKDETQVHTEEDFTPMKIGELARRCSNDVP